MIYRDFGEMKWNVSAIGMGTWNIGNQWGEMDDAASFATIRAAYENGTNLFDAAESYGNPNGMSEMRLGTALAGIRHKAFVVSKIGNWGKRTGQGVPMTTVDMVRLCAHASLYRLKTDWLDAMLCHEGDIKDPDVYLEGFESLKKSGEIREYGISTDSLDSLKAFNKNGTCRIVQADYSLLNRKAEDGILPYCMEHGIAVMVRGPLAKGALSGKYDENTVFTDSVRAIWNAGGAQRSVYERNIAEVKRIQNALQAGEDLVETAIRFAISHPSAPVAIPGATSPRQAASNAMAGSKVLSAEEIAALLRN